MEQVNLSRCNIQRNMLVYLEKPIYLGGGTPTKSLNKSGVELSNKISWRNRSSKNTLSDK